MKSIPRIIPLLLVTAMLAHSQDAPRSASGDPEIAGTTLTTAHIIGEIPDGTPPPPSQPKPEYYVAARDVLSTTTHKQDGRTITMREIKPITLPTPPPPAEIAVGEVDNKFTQRLADYREAHPNNELLFLGTTVFRPKDGPPRTLVRWWPQGGKGTIPFWSSADFALIAGGINAFVDSLGDTHHMVMSWSNVDIDLMSELNVAKGRNHDTPDLPEFPEGEATFEITGNTKPTAEEMAVIESLHHIYNSELKRLRAAYEGRERARIQREEFLKANPPKPQDITLNFWRTEKPDNNKEGESK